MSETSHAAGRIAILTAFTVLFAVAWRTDAPVKSLPLTPLSGTKRGSGCIADTDCTGNIARGALVGQDNAIAAAATFRAAGSRATNAIIPATAVAEVAMPFSGTPALLGRSTVAADSRTAAKGAGEPTR